METRLRLVLVRAGSPKPVTQFNVYDDENRFVGRLDMAYPSERVGVEYDGEHHFERRAHANDRRRHNGLARAGWTLLYFTAADVYQRPELIVAQVARVISTA